jgi:type II secretory pathway component PulM
MNGLMPAAIRQRFTSACVWLDARPARERQVLRTALVLVPALLIWLWIWEPLSAAHARLARTLPAARLQAIEFDRQASAFERMPARPARDATPARSPSEAIAASAARNGLGNAIGRVEAAGNDRLQVRLESVDFALLVRWLGRLAADDGLVVDSLQAQAAGPGQVRVERLLLMPAARRAPRVAASASAPSQAR